MADQYSITICPAEKRAEAIRLLHEGLAPDQQTGLVQALEVIQEAGLPDFPGLLIASRDENSLDEKIEAAAWIQPTPGKTAVLWPPSPQSPASPALMQAIAGHLDQQDVPLAQILVSPDTPVDPDLFAVGQFHKLADLAYLLADSSYLPPQVPGTDLQFVPQANDQLERLGKLLIQTYQDSLDCPVLNGVRNESDVLQGYAAQGNATSGHWYFVCDQQRHDIGTLILTEHGNGEQWELVYMGLIPAARGQGFGRQIVQHALWQANQGGAQRLVLAVDQANPYALDMYHQAGFISWDRRTVYARLQPQPD